MIKMGSRFIDTVSSLSIWPCTYDDEKIDDEEYDFVRALSMSGGDGVNSYSANSLLQRRVLSMVKPVLIKNTKEMMINLDFPKYIKIAELGCSSGQNSFLAISEIINTINVLCQKANQTLPEIACCLNDLPENDFNTTFKSIPFFKKELMITNKASCFIYGTPGSFYSRLFSRNSLHFIHSSYALHWLSKVPEKLKNDKKNVYITRSSPQSVYKAYLNQFRSDFTIFLKLRSEEMVSNGRMVLTFIGRNNVNDPLFRDCCHFWTLLSKSLYDLVCEGLISESKLDTFNMPFYDPNIKELKEVIGNEGSFEINEVETHRYDISHSNHDCYKEEDGYKPGRNEANYIRAVTEPMLVAHFGQDIIEHLFDKYAHHVTQHGNCLNKTSVNLVVSLTKST